VFTGLDRIKSFVYQSVAVAPKQHTLHNDNVSIRKIIQSFG